MTNNPPNKRDVQRLAAARGIKYTAALRALSKVPEQKRHQYVLEAEATAARESLDLDDRRNWSDRVARDLAAELLRESPLDVLAPPAGVLPDLEEAEYVLAGVESVEESYVDEYEGGDELYNLEVVLELTIEGTLAKHVPADVLVAAGITPLQYGPGNLAVRLPMRRVRVEIAGLLNRGNDYLWEPQEHLGYEWLHQD